MPHDLPARANLEHLKKQAKELLRAAESGDADAIARLRGQAGRPGDTPLKLADAQHAVAREYGFATWRALREFVEANAAPVDPLEALALAVKADDVERAGALFARHPTLARRLEEPMPGGDFGERILNRAVRHQSRAMVDLLLGHGADIDGRSHWWAGSFGVLDNCEPSFAPFLIERGATVDANAAARLGLLDRLEALVAADPNAVHARGGDGQTPLHVAKNLEVARFLVEHGADVNARDVDHESTPAQYLIGDRGDVVAFLVERGAESDLLLAAALGDVDLVRRHLDERPDAIRMRVSPEWFPMRNPRAGGIIYIWTLGNHKTAHTVARDRGHADVLALLLERSPATVRFTDACIAGDDATIAALLAGDPSLPRTLSATDRALLVAAAWEGRTATVKRLLAAGWPVGATGHNGATALHVAAWLGEAEMVRELLRHGAPLDVREREFDALPLGWAVHGSTNSWRREQGDYGGVIDALLDAGSPVPQPVEGGSAAVREAFLRHTERRREHRGRDRG